MCECFQKANELAVKQLGLRFRMSTNLTTGKVKAIVATEPVPDGKKHKGFIIAAFCPFCGEKYPDV